MEFGHISSHSCVKTFQYTYIDSQTHSRITVNMAPYCLE